MSFLVALAGAAIGATAAYIIEQPTKYINQISMKGEQA